MSTAKRPRETDWATQPNASLDKREYNDFWDRNYEEQQSWQTGLEGHHSQLGQISISNFAPAMELPPDTSDIFQQDLFRPQNEFSNGFHSLDEALMDPSMQNFEWPPLGSNPRSFDETYTKHRCLTDSILKSPSEAIERRNVCFGTLYDVKIQLEERIDSTWLNNKRLIFFEGGTDIEAFLTLQLAFKEQYCMLQLNDGGSFGVLNKMTFASLTSLSCFEQLSYTALIHRSSWGKERGESSNESKSRCVSLDINISGPECVQSAIASELSRNRLFLQPPQRGTTALPYENPQFLHLPEVLHAQERNIVLNGQESNTGPPGLISKASAALDDQFPDIDVIFAKLPQHEYSKQSVVDPRIKTTLLSHQQEAADFVVKRESPNTYDWQSLWERKILSEGVQHYQHIITGAKSPVPNDFLGGILADDMGLGKSLTMLSAVIASLSLANERVYQNLGRFFDNRPSRDAQIVAKSTLIIVPSALLLDGWIDEINKHIIRGALRYYKYHGQDRPTDPSALAQYDIVLTTYGTVTADASRSRNVLERVNWYRMIVDEAHVIRNLSTKQFRAVAKIPAHIRWCLSGTPIQNSLADLGALVAFLRVPILKEPATFRKYIDCFSRTMKTNSKNDFENLRRLLGSICLRRSKMILPLFGLKVEERRPQFSTSEREEYRRLEVKCRMAIDMAVSGHNTKETHQSVIEGLLRLRLFCNNGSSQQENLLDSFSRDPEEVLSFLQQSGEAICRYCSCDVLSISEPGSPGFVHLTSCRRLICGECVIQYQHDLKIAQREERGFCPFCSDENCADNTLPKDVGESAKITRAATSYPSKLITLLNDVQANSAREKSIVFSFWKKSLDLVGDLFAANEVRYCRVDGSFALGKRKTILSEFQKSHEMGVLLMTLGTGAVGLNNLSIASRIYLLEPQWNPSVENQAIGRVFRLGQGRPVSVIRYIMDKTIEEAVQSRQSRKLRLACGGFDVKASSQRNEQLQQLKNLLPKL